MQTANEYNRIPECLLCGCQTLWGYPGHIIVMAQPGSKQLKLSTCDSYLSGTAVLVQDRAVAVQLLLRLADEARKVWPDFGLEVRRT